MTRYDGYGSSQNRGSNGSNSKVRCSVAVMTVSVPRGRCVAQTAHATTRHGTVGPHTASGEARSGEFTMQSMRAAVVDSVPGVPTIQDVEISEPGLGEVLIRTA